MAKANKKYQVFISSTYTDLKEERSAVMQCLLEMNCIPVGMEQFPASNMSQMEYIKMMLDDCDYYVLILAGRYGSCDTDGIGYTEKEYDYAISKGIPVMSFVVDDIGNLVSSKCENTDEGREKLKLFKEKVCTGKMIKFYNDIGSLKSAVAVSLIKCIMDFPAIGWVRGDSTNSDGDIEKKIEEYLKNHTISNDEIDALFEKENMSTEIPIGVKTALEELASRIPKISSGTTPPENLEEGESYIQYV